MMSRSSRCAQAGRRPSATSTRCQPASASSALPGTGRVIIHDVLLGTGEALSNAMEHGSDLDPRRTVSVEAFAAEDEISVTVTDSGQWLKDSSASRDSERGYGLKLIHGLATNSET